MLNDMGHYRKAVMLQTSTSVIVIRAVMEQHAQILSSIPSNARVFQATQGRDVRLVSTERVSLNWNLSRSRDV